MKKLPLIKTNLYQKLHTLDIVKRSVARREGDCSFSALAHESIDVFTDTFSSLCMIDVVDQTNPIDIGKNLTKYQSEAVIESITKNYLEFPTNEIVPSTYTMKINLLHDTPISTKPRRLSFAEREKVKVIVPK